MRNALLIVPVIIASLVTAPRCHAQSDFRVSDPRLELKGSKIMISYDILNSSPDDRFDIKIAISDSAGNLIRAHTLEGDVGETVPGGNNKQIYWDFRADQIIMNGDIYVNITAEVLPPDPDGPGANSATEESKVFSRPTLILQSAALPGLGLSRMKNRPHWVRGMAGYGCIAGALIMNRTAVSTYQDFQSAQNVENADALLQEATRQDNISDILGFTALGIWVTDLVWTLLATSGDEYRPGNQMAAGFSLRSSFDVISNCPTVGLVYRF